MELYSETIEVDLLPTFLKLPTDNDISNTQLKNYLEMTNNCIIVADWDLYKIENHPNQEKLDCLCISCFEQAIILPKLLCDLEPKLLRKIKGIIVFTYDSDSFKHNFYVEPENLKSQIYKTFGNTLDRKQIEVILTNSEIFELANSSLYKKEVNIYVAQKSSLILYGITLGEMIYPKVVNLIKQGNQKAKLKKQTKYIRNILILFLIVTSLNIGGEALYELLTTEEKGKSSIVFLISFLFSILLPILILIVKPDWLISLDE